MVTVLVIHIACMCYCLLVIAINWTGVNLNDVVRYNFFSSCKVGMKRSVCKFRSYAVCVYMYMCMCVCVRVCVRRPIYVCVGACLHLLARDCAILFSSPGCKQ